MASCYDQIEVVKLLLAHPAIDVNVKNRGGCTPFYYACAGGHLSVIELLLKDPVSMSHWMIMMAALHCGMPLFVGSWK